MSFSLTDVISKIQENKSLKAAGVESKSSVAPNTSEYKSIDEILFDQFNGDGAKVKQFKSICASNGVFKDVTSAEMGPVRIQSLFPIISQIQNDETKFLSILRGRAPYRCTDMQVRIPVEDIVSDLLPFFHVDGSLPAVYQSKLSEFTNTVGAVGQQIQISMLAKELAAQSPYRRDELAAQLQKAMLRIDRSMNAYLLSNLEQTGEAIPNEIPQPGGFVTRSVLNNQAIGASNLTDAYITAAVDSIAARFGYDQLSDLVVLTSKGQIRVVRDLMINRYPGTTAMTKKDYDQELAGRAAMFGVPVQMMYEDNNAQALPFIREQQLPTGTTIVFKGNVPRLGLLELGGNFGPWVIERPITALYSLDVAFNMFTLVDPMPESRSLILGTYS